MKSANKWWMASCRLLSLIVVMMVSTLTAKANDAVYFVNGSHLEPLQETDIAIKKEILTITLGDDGIAYVEVDYTFMNNGKAKDITMGFEASAPYNDGEKPNFKGAHPHIMDFTVAMNGQALRYSNGVVFMNTDIEDMPKEVLNARKNGQVYVPVDFKKWDYDEENSERLHNKQTDEYASFSYAYYFKAHFNSGLNTVRHTYSYRMSYGVGAAFNIPYWLMPAMRWANHQIDDFTLRIHANNCTKHFIIDEKPFKGTPFKVTKGKGKTRIMQTNLDEMNESVVEVVLRDGTLEWHRNNFRTNCNMSINSADNLEFMVDWGNKPKPLYYDSGSTFFWWKNYEDLYPGKGTEKQMKEFSARIRRNLPYAHRGYVFKDAQLRRIFESQWWYMPDPKWKPNDNSLSAHEQELIKMSNEL